MWCRTILTAVAISYVICMLLWSGLQKEDLDAKTLEKLGRYNVNIDDMNNEKQRQECLSQHVTTEPQRQTFRKFGNTEGIKNYVSEMYPRIEKLFGTKFDDVAVIQHEVSNNKSKGYFDPTPEIPQKISDLGNSTKVKRNKAAIKIEYDLQNQDLESVMSVWTKLTRYNTTVVTTLQAPSPTPIATAEHGETHNAKNGMTTVQAVTHNIGYVHSREMEYMSRMLAEYLASQTVATTTQRAPTKKVFLNEKEKPNPLNGRWSINNKNNAPQNNLRFEDDIYNSLLDKTKSMPFDVTFDSAHLIKRIQVKPLTQILDNEPKIRPKSVPVKKNNPLEHLFNILQMKSNVYNNGVPIPESESTSQTIELLNNKSNEEKEKRKFDLFNIFPIMNFINKNFSKNYIMNNDEPTIATIKANTWESVPLSNENINKEFKDLPIGNKEKFLLQKLYEQFKAAPSSIYKMRSNTDDDKTMDTFEPKLVQKYNTNKNRIEVRPPDINQPTLYENSHMDQSQPWFQAIPSSESTNNQVQEMSTGFNRLDQNKNIQLLTNQNDRFKTDSGIISKRGPDYDSIKMESMNNFDRDNEQRTPNMEKSLILTKHEKSMSLYEFKAEQANIIKDIAEKVKRMVLRQMNEVTTTVTVTTTSTTTTTTTAPPTTTTTAAPTTTTTTAVPTTTTTTTTAKTLSEKPPTALRPEASQTSHVIQKLMEIFKELKADKNTSTLTSQLPQNTNTESHSTRRPPPLPIRLKPQVAVSSNPYFMHKPTILKSKPASSYTPIIEVPINSMDEPPRMKAPQYTPLLNVQPAKEYHVGAITLQTNSEEIKPLVLPMLKPLKLVNQNIVVTTTEPFDKVKQEHEQISIKQIEKKLRKPPKAKHTEFQHHRVSTKHDRLADDLIKDETRDHNFYKSKYMNREKQWYNHDFNREAHNIENTHLDMSRFPELHYPGRLSHLQHLGRPRESTRPGFNKHTIHEDEVSHHPFNPQSSYTNYDHHPRYEATKFHEKLEKSENWPESSWKDLKVSENNYDEISGRQQLPLLKVKQRTRYDESHFTNFLKSQQKVTDMLEQILANNVKNSQVSAQHSVETL